MNPRPWADSSLARFPACLEVAPAGPARRVRAGATQANDESITVDFDHGLGEGPRGFLG